MRWAILAVLAVLAYLVAGGEPIAGPPAVEDGTADRDLGRGGDEQPRVVGSAAIDGGARVATVVWKYEENGRPVETTVPPRMRVVRMTSDVRRIMVKLPSELFAIRIGDDLLREFEEPLLVHSDQVVTCSCQMREDCVAGETFRCEIEAYLEAVAPAVSGRGPGAAGSNSTGGERRD